MPAYEYVTSINRYRNAQTKVFVPRETVMTYVDAVIDAGSDASSDLARLWVEGSLSAQDFGVQMRDELKSSYIQNYILGRGGRDQMMFSDWGAVGNMLREQYAYLDGFVADLEAGGLSEAQVRARARLYFQGTREAYERGNGVAHGVPRLPAYPGDQSTLCKSGCKCRWRFHKLPGRGNADCYWEIDPDAQENCETCVSRYLEWSPLLVRDGVLQPYHDIRAEAHHHGPLHVLEGKSA